MKNNYSLNLTSYQDTVSSGKSEIKEEILVHLVELGLEIPDWLERVAFLNATDIIIESLDNDLVTNDHFLVLKNQEGEEDVVTVNKGSVNYLGEETFRGIFKDKRLLSNLISMNYKEQEVREHEKRIEKVNAYIRGELVFDQLKISDVLKVLPNHLRISHIDKAGYVVYNIKNTNTLPFILNCTDEYSDITGEYYDFTKEMSMQLYISRRVTYELKKVPDGAFTLIETIPKDVVIGDRKVIEREQTELLLDTLTSITLVQLRTTGKTDKLKELIDVIVTSVPRKRRNKSMLQDVFRI